LRGDTKIPPNCSPFALKHYSDKHLDFYSYNADEQVERMYLKLGGLSDDLVQVHLTIYNYLEIL